MQQITWTSESGRKVSVELRTERIVSADGQMVPVDDWTLRVEVEGIGALYGCRLRDDAQHGLLFDAGCGKLVRVPVDQREAVKVLVNTYETEVERRLAAADAVDAEYAAGRERMRKLMGY